MAAEVIIVGGGMKQLLEEEEARKVVQVLGVHKAKELLLLCHSDRLPVLSTVFHAQKGEHFQLTPAFWQQLITCLYGNLLLPSSPITETIGATFQKRLSVGCPQLDAFFRGGFSIGQGQIYEFCGEAGVGKTQWMLQLSIVSQLKAKDGGLDSKVIYICTTSRFPSSRLQQLIAAFVQKYPYLNANRVASDIIVETVTSMEQLQLVVDSRLAYLLSRTNAKVVIIDSIARLFRASSSTSGEDGLSSMYPTPRSRLLYRLGIALKKTAYKYETLLLVTNEMTGQPAVFPDIHSIVQTPCLGKAWKHNVNHRFYLRKLATWCGSNLPDEVFSSRRQGRELQVAFSTEYDSGSRVMFQIRWDGIGHWGAIG